MRTYYADVLVAKQQKLARVGQYAYFAHGMPNTWADGQRVIVGQDSIDFDLALVERDAAHHRASLLIRHVPPRHPQVHLPAEWMQAPVAGTPNNWVQVTHANGRYVAQVGQETFDLRIVIDTNNGAIESAHMDNPLVTVSRECDDVALLRCGPAKREESGRVINLTRLP